MKTGKQFKYIMALGGAEKTEPNPHIVSALREMGFRKWQAESVCAILALADQKKGVGSLAVAIIEERLKLD